jgi:lysophospholipase L1-like esterase
MRIARLAAVFMTPLISFCMPAAAQTAGPCGPFTREALPAPEPHPHPYAQQRFARVIADIKTQPHRALFLGDSLTEGWPPPLWQQHMAPRGVLNAGVAGDSTENLRWRLDRGDLDGAPPHAVIVLIGTNDIGQNRSPELAAEGVRAVLAKLRARLPNAPILLLGLLPRGEWPGDNYRLAASAVNRLIQSCGDGRRIVYADIGSRLLDRQGRLTTAIAPEALHLSPEGYALLAPQLDSLLDRILAQTP